MIFKFLHLWGLFLCVRDAGCRGDTITETLLHDSVMSYFDIYNMVFVYW